MEYIEVKIVIEPFNEDFADILSAELAQIGFESFVTGETGLNAWVRDNIFDESEIKNIADTYKDLFRFTYECENIKTENWNEEWEKNFQPIRVDDRCLIKGTFHHNLPDAEYTITIDPKMSFGTGHHETTQLMILRILDNNFEKQTILDMGCGTGVLAILASMRKAEHITAIDIEEWAYNNTVENIALNNCSNINIIRGDVSSIPDERYHTILANINKNVLLVDIPKYVEYLLKNGSLFVSGIYVEDKEDIVCCASRAGLTFVDFIEKNRWISIHFKK